jgi:2-polyprenyl-6-methoxyphenol hydroxylase-like FAD-dependent oxidoreductase
MNQAGQHAIVIGASMGGLMAARALAEHYAKVTIVDRDDLADTGEPRKGVPQGRHAHGLLARGREVLEEFFPGLSEELVSHGALRCDILDDVLWYSDGAHLKRAKSDMIGLLLSRPMLEEHVRRRLLQRGNVLAMDATSVLGLVADAGGGRITGIRLKRNGGELDLDADLVVDASGRGSRSPAWLAELGYAAPAEETVAVDIGYVTRSYRRRPGQLGGRQAVAVTPSMPDWRGGVVLAHEHDRWIVSIGGYFGDHAPADEAGFLAFAKAMQAPEIHALIKDAEPLSPFAVYKFPANRRLRYERLERFPEGLLVFGDAMCSFNPVYGQGMTVATLEALALRQCLRQGQADLARRFFRLAKPIVDIPWDVAVGNDLRNAKVEGPRGAMVRFINWYVGKLHFAARADAALAGTFLKVANMTAPPFSLLHPATAWRVLRGNMRPAARRPIEATAA